MAEFEVLSAFGPFVLRVRPVLDGVPFPSTTMVWSRVAPVSVRAARRRPLPMIYLIYRLRLILIFLYSLLHLLLALSFFSSSAAEQKRNSTRRRS